MTNRQLAQNFAENFAYQHRDRLVGFDAKKIAFVISEELLALGDGLGPDWHTYPPAERYYVMYDSTRILLVEHLNALYTRLTPVERFRWRSRLCRLILSYMESLTGSNREPALDYLAAYAGLVSEAITTSEETACRQAEFFPRLRHAVLFIYPRLN